MANNSSLINQFVEKYKKLYSLPEGKEAENLRDSMDTLWYKFTKEELTIANLLCVQYAEKQK